MSDPFKNYTPGLESPATSVEAITPDDGTDLVQPSRALNVAQSGLVQITTLDDTTATVFIAAGIPFPVRAKRVWATGTTAVGIVSLC
ncbi:MAG: hypothetical protein AAFO98_00565 [Pseudomonadota bacterium]